MAIGFSIQFRINEKTSSRVIRLTDTSTGFTLAKGNFSIVFPDGSAINHTDFLSPDITTPLGSYEFQASTDIYNNVLTGTYSISFVALDSLNNSYNLVRSFNFNWIKPTTDIQNKSDVFIPEVQFFDATSYLTVGNFVGTLSRTFSVPFPTNSEVSGQPATSTSTTTLTPVYDSKFYEGLYNISLDVTVDYTNDIYSYLTLYYTNLTTKTYDIRQVPTQLQLVSKLNAFRIDVDVYKEKNDTQFEIMSENYDIAIALYSHLIARFETNTLDGSQPLLEELLSILEPYNGIYSYKSTQLTPFTLGVAQNQYFTLSDGTHTDNFPLQSTLLFSTGNSALGILVSDNTITFTPTFGSTSGTFASGDDSRFHTPVTLGTANGLSLASQAISLALATTGTSGAMSASDKAKLDGIATGATANVGTVTSVGLSMPSAFSVANSPVTGAGTLAVTATGTSAQYITGTGALATLNTLNVPENTNLYFTTSRARTSISLTTTGTTGSATYDNTTGVLNIPSYIGGVTSFNTRTGAIVLSGSDVTTALGFTPYNATNPAGYITGITSSNVTTALGYTPENSANKGIANGYASLNSSGVVPSTQLPSYVDDVLEYTNLASFPATGETGKIYVDLATNKVYRWSGSTYIEISASSGGGVWGGITGTLANQTDLQSALDAKVPTSRILTINNVSYDLTTDRSWTITAAAGAASLVQQQVRAAVAVTKGQAVYVSGADGTNMLVSKASNISDAMSSKTLGLVDASVSANGLVNVVTEGVLTGLNTIGATIGDPVWLGVDGNLIYGTTNRPLAPSHLVFIGFVTRVNANNGEIFVKVQNGFELGELHNVAAHNGSAANNDGLFWESATQLWKNKSIATILGYTPANPANVVPYTGATGAVDLGAYDLTVNGITVGKGTGVTNGNTVVGNSAFSHNTIGTDNTAIGEYSLFNNTTGYNNTAIGSYALGYNTTGVSNIGIGYNTLAGIGTGSYNVGVGNSIFSFGGYQSVGNVAMGDGVFYGMNGDKNVGIGFAAFSGFSTSGNENVGIGYNALGNTNSGDYNIALGTSSLANNNGGDSNIAIGKSSLQSNSGSNNVAIGEESIKNNGIGYSNVAVGYKTLLNNTTGYTNVALGANALHANTIGNGNIAVGSDSLLSNTGGFANVAIGLSALNSNTTGGTNIAIGYGSLYSNTEGTDNIAIGNGAMNNAGVSTAGNIAIGSNANPNNSGYSNIGIGSNTLYQNPLGIRNVAIGDYSLAFNSGDYNVAIGDSAGVTAGTVSYNIFLGFAGDGSNYADNYRTWIGYNDTIATWLGGSILVGTKDIVPSAMMVIDSTTKGFLTARMTTTEKNAISTPATGLEVYDTTKNKKSVYNGSFWDDGFKWFDYVAGKTTVTETAVSGGVVQEFSYSGTTEKRYRFIGDPYDSATDIIYKTYSGGVLSNPLAYKLITL